MRLTDICCNLTHESFNKDRDAVLQRARAAGVTRFLLAGADLAESRACVALAQQHDDCWAAVGVHPHQSREWAADSAETLRELQQNPRVLAIGECGLDHYRDLSPRDIQLAAFSEQFHLAGELGLPVLLHNREADEDFLRVIDQAAVRPPRMVLHCFTGDATLLHACLERGLYIGLTGWFCDERRGQSVRDLVDQIPLDRLMIETDAPYLLPRTLRPHPKTRRNEPVWLGHIAKQIAEARGMDPEEFAHCTQACAQEFFAFPDKTERENPPVGVE